MRKDQITEKMSGNVFIKMLEDKLSIIGIDDWKVYHYTEVTSTNDVARELLTNHENIIVLADVQTSGRGTKDRIWESPLGGVWISVATKKVLPVEDYSSMIADRLTKVYSDIIDVNCVHKPVNDILLNGRKLAGVLVETKIIGSEITEFVAGIGVNMYNPIPDYLKEIAIAMSEVTTANSVFEVAQETALEIILLLRNFFKKV